MDSWETQQGTDEEARRGEDGAGGALLLTPPPPEAGAGRLALAMSAWLHAKFQRSQSVKTRTAYASILAGFRAALMLEGLDLDAADPRRCRADLLAVAPYRTMDRLDDLDDVDRLDDLVAARAAAIALVAQSYAARPAESRYGARPVAPTTANLRLAAISSFYTYALRQDLVRGLNPVARVERRHVEAYAAAHPLSYEDLRVQLAALDLTTDAGLRDYALLLVALSTGRRVAELAGMRREHLVIRARRVEIAWPRCKGGKRMRDELPRGGARGEAADALVAWLSRLDERQAEQQAQRHSEPSDATAVRPTTSHAISHAAAHVMHAGFAAESGLKLKTPQEPQRQFERPIWVSLARNGTAGHPLTARAIAHLCEKRLGTSKVHALRHTFARALEDAGAKVSEIQAALGHADLGTTGRYLARLHQGENRHLARLSALYGLGGLDHRLDPVLGSDSASEVSSGAQGVNGDPGTSGSPHVGAAARDEETPAEGAKRPETRKNR